MTSQVKKEQHGHHHVAVVRLPAGVSNCFTLLGLKRKAKSHNRAVERRAARGLPAKLRRGQPV
eukprot:6401223-Pyramimonas_sp.AAC.1